MRTLVVSDLHLGARTQADVLRRPEPRDALLRALGARGAPGAVDRLVLLGDVLELRGGPVRHALEAAQGFFEAVGEALDGRELILLAGNHDHAVVAPGLERRVGPLPLEERFEPGAASYIAAALDDFLGPRTSLEVAHPGVWLREDVYAMHGNYLDRHVTVPSLERIGIGAMSRLIGSTTGRESSPDDYEALTAPIYAWVQAVSQSGPDGGGLLEGGASASVRVRRALLGGGGGLDGARARFMAAAFPVIIAALNRAGVGPLRGDLSGAALRRSSLEAMALVCERLALGAAHVIFGHTHRAGQLPGDGLTEWTTPSGARLHNCGCWVFETYLMTHVDGGSPYWPGGCVVLDDEGPPRLLRLLADRSTAELMPG
ncbi:MAG TPA: metallophosphoesterase [Solirubrobacteraceae bacterium]|nr:metallophosphoesterase [Solirubrobacteraceae bacterium]